LFCETTRNNPKWFFRYRFPTRVLATVSCTWSYSTLFDDYTDRQIAFQPDYESCDGEKNRDEGSPQFDTF